MSNLHRFTINSPEWGEVKILRPIPTGEDGWGSFAPLRGTVWEDLLPIVDGEATSHALHGHATPLMRQIGLPPKALLQLVPAPHRACSLMGGCIAYKAVDCQPRSKMPDCFTPDGVSDEIQLLAATVLLAWKEGYYVVIVSGPEFSL